MLIFTVFTWFLIPDKIQNGHYVGDVTGLQQGPSP